MVYLDHKMATTMKPQGACDPKRNIRVTPSIKSSVSVTSSKETEVTAKYKQNYDVKKLEFTRNLLRAEVTNLLKQPGPKSWKEAEFEKFTINKGVELFKEARFTLVETKVKADAKYPVCCRVYPADKKPEEFYLKVLRHLGRKHASIVQTWEIFQEENGSILIVQDFCPSNLESLIKGAQPVKEPQVQIMAWQLLRALHFLGDIGLAHREIQPKNILIKPATEANYIVKLSNFYKAIIYWNIEENDVVYSPCRKSAEMVAEGESYQAPEVYGQEGEEYDTIIADTWSYGAVIYHMLSRAYPFKVTDKVEDLQKEIQENINKLECGDDGKELLAHILSINASHRMPFGCIEQHEWFVIAKRVKLEPIAVGGEASDQGGAPPEDAGLQSSSEINMQLQSIVFMNPDDTKASATGMAAAEGGGNAGGESNMSISKEKSSTSVEGSSTGGKSIGGKSGGKSISGGSSTSGTSMDGSSTSGSFTSVDGSSVGGKSIGGKSGGSKSISGGSSTGGGSVDGSSIVGGSSTSISGKSLGGKSGGKSIGGISGASKSISGKSGGKSISGGSSTAGSSVSGASTDGSSVSGSSIGGKSIGGKSGGKSISGGSSTGGGSVDGSSIAGGSSTSASGKSLGGKSGGGKSIGGKSGGKSIGGGSSIGSSFVSGASTDGGSSVSESSTGGSSVSGSSLAGKSIGGKSGGGKSISGDKSGGSKSIGGKSGGKSIAGGSSTGGSSVSGASTDGGSSVSGSSTGGGSISGKSGKSISGGKSGGSKSGGKSIGGGSLAASGASTDRSSVGGKSLGGGSKNKSIGGKNGGSVSGETDSKPSYAKLRLQKAGLRRKSKSKPRSKSSKKRRRAKSRSNKRRLKK